VLPDDVALLTARLGAKTPVDIRALKRAGFFESCKGVIPKTFKPLAKSRRATEKRRVTEKQKSRKDTHPEKGDRLSEPVRACASRFSLEQCMAYVQACKRKGEIIRSVRALALHLARSNEADPFIEKWLNDSPKSSAKADSPSFPPDPGCKFCHGLGQCDAQACACTFCPLCHGTGTERTGKGARNCSNCISTDVRETFQTGCKAADDSGING
jgi:hypothetical protein